MTTTDKTFFGIPIEGDIRFAESPVKQRPLEDLQPLLQALLDDPTIKWFGWRQYTPYFNDGEPCVFSVDEALMVSLTPDPRSRQQPQADDNRCSSCGTALYDESWFCHSCGTKQLRDDVDDDEDEDEDIWDGVEYNKLLGHRNNSWEKSPGVYTGPDEERYDRCLALEQALASGAFDDVLLEHFGDHAVVTVSREKITVKEYSHD